MTAPLDDILASRSHVRVARALDELPESLDVSARDLERRAQVVHARALEVLGDFGLNGVIRVRRAGRADLYQFNREHVLYPALQALFRAERTVETELHAFLRTRLRKLPLREAYVFGSVARGESKQESDVDLAVVLRFKAAPKTAADVEAQLEDLAGAVRRRFGSDLGIYVSATTLAERVKGRVGRDLWRRIQAEGVPLLSET